MHPVLFNLGFIEIYSYGFMVATAFLVSTFLLSRRSRVLGVESGFIWDLSLWLILGGIFGGRILYILLNLNYFLNNPLEMIMFWRGGLVWYGGFLGGFLAGIFYLRKNKVAIVRALDLIAPYVALGQAIGRIGCFLNGCCYGRLAVSWGIFFPAHSRYLVPTQLYSSLGLVAIFIILRIFQEKPHNPGAIFIFYLILYSTQRFFMEFLRNDSGRNYFGLTIFQLISLVILIVALSFGLIIRQRESGRL